MTTKTSENIDRQKQPEKFTIIYSTKNQLKQNYININDNHYEKYKKAQVKLNMKLNSSKKNIKTIYQIVLFLVHIIIQKLIKKTNILL